MKSPAARPAFTRRPHCARRRCALAGPLLAGAILTALATVALAGELDFRPGFNLFSVAQDVQVGKANAAQVEKELPLLRDDEATRYLNDLGRRLSRYAPNNPPDYVWQFKVIDSADVNAFALPGGYIYVNRATLASAQDEAQLAGVLAHEEGHVVLRHGTHQATESLLAEKLPEILGGLLGQGDSLLSKLTQAGIGLGVQSLLLHNSRAMETQADSVGAYILYQAGYDPHALAQFFEIIKQRYPQDSGVIANFVADHPDPGNRIAAVDQEIPELGPAKVWLSDDTRFEAVRIHLLTLPPPPKPRPQPQGA
ncbi:MAG TPA: M48 family metallopeptidase [Terriglobia bacterium]|nr:M48 family metallopeptidase [Terriglobia bacterium]